MANNRRAGHNYERETRKNYQLLFPDREILTSRYASKYADDFLKRDLINTEPFAVQCKVMTGKHLDLVKIFASMKYSEEEIPLIHLKLRQKQGRRFRTKAKLVVMFEDDFYKYVNSNENGPTTDQSGQAD